VATAVFSAVSCTAVRSAGFKGVCGFQAVKMYVGAFHAGRRGFASRLPLHPHEFGVCARLTLPSGAVTGRTFHLDLCLHSPMICRFLPSDRCLLPAGRVMCCRAHRFTAETVEQLPPYVLRHTFAATCRRLLDALFALIRSYPTISPGVELRGQVNLP
jgi:hypothetical protein